MGNSDLSGKLFFVVMSIIFPVCCDRNIFLYSTNPLANSNTCILHALSTAIRIISVYYTGLLHNCNQCMDILGQGDYYSFTPYSFNGTCMFSLV